MMARSPITTHVLDTTRGRPADGMVVVLEFWERGETWKTLARGKTDGDGRITNLLSPSHVLVPGVYRLMFDTGTYFHNCEVPYFYPCVPVMFEVKDPAQHYHVPLLLNPFGYGTYRGS